MNDRMPTEADHLPAEWLQLFPLIWGYMGSALISAALHLKLADRLGDAARTSEELAVDTGAHAPSLTRLLRAMCSIGLTVEVEPGRFALTPIGAPLRSDVPGSVYTSARMYCDESTWRAWGDLRYSVLTGKPAFDEVVGAEYFQHVAESPELSKIVNGAMSRGTQLFATDITREFDFSPFHTVVDVGGGDGTLLAMILSANPGLRGIVYDTPTGSDAAPATFKAAGVADRAEVRAGDFFVSVPEGGDLYLLNGVIHDWDDERCAVILAHCRQAMHADGRLLLVDHVLPPQVQDPPVPPFAGPEDALAYMSNAFVYLSDINMLVTLGGQERTEDEFGRLLSGSGFRVTGFDLLPGPARMSLIEARPV
jgi:O-methyltransferase domain